MARDKLPARAPHETIKFVHSFVPYHATVTYYDMTGTRPGAIFMSTGKSGEDMQTLMRDNAIIASIALQHGATLDELKAAISRQDDGTPMGPMGTLLDILKADEVSSKP
ncbi:MAG: hypothetical protein KKB37_11190 [Alphaproteobacteria bacterium]|nr:hypothetical protein [Alphaproteobacteria bacterium]